MTAPRPRRPRRSTEEVRRAIRDVARSLFDEKGYQGTTTLEIGKRARVSERLIFEHFGNKVGLFNAAVIAPFADVVAVYVDSWLTDVDAANPERRVDYLVNGLYDLAREHRRALLTALAENDNGPSAQENLLDQLGRSFQRMLAIIPAEEYRGLDMPALLATVVGMVLGVALLDELIYPSAARRPSRQRLVDEMRTTLLDGMRHRT